MWKSQSDQLEKLLGRQGEDDALNWLKKHRSFSFLERNFRTKWGELDLVMKSPDGTVVFVEVKSRVVNPFGSVLEQIDDTKISHLKKAIDLFLDQKSWQEKSCRLDGVGIEYAVIETISGYEFKPINFEHVEDLTGW